METCFWQTRLSGRDNLFRRGSLPCSEIVRLKPFAYGAFFLAMAVGLWRLQKWARHSLIGFYGFRLALTARGLLYYGAISGLHSIAPYVQSLYLYALFELMVMLALLYSTGVAQSFREVE